MTASAVQLPTTIQLVPRQKPPLTELIQPSKNALQKLDRYIEARTALTQGKKQGNNSEVIRRLESAERHAAYLLMAVADDLRDELVKQGEL